MRIENPFTINESIVQQLTSAEANGNLAVLAANAVNPPNTKKLVNQTAPFLMTFPQKSIFTDSAVIETAGAQITQFLAVFILSFAPIISECVPLIGVIDSSLGQGDLGGTYANGAAGVGATITGSVPGVGLQINGIAVTPGGRYVITDQTNTFENGVYTVTDDGTGANPWQITRSTDFNMGPLIHEGSYFYVANRNGAYFQTSPTPINVGVDPITFADFQNTMAIHPLAPSSLQYSSGPLLIFPTVGSVSGDFGFRNTPTTFYLLPFAQDTVTLPSWNGVSLDTFQNYFVL